MGPMGPLWRGSSIGVFLSVLRYADSAEPEAPSAHPKIPGFHNFRPELMLPDYDCHFLPESWLNMVTDFLGSLELVGITGSARASGYETLEGELEIWNNYAEILADRPVLARDCPFTNFLGRISLWTCCKIIEKLEKSRTPEARRASKGAPDHCEELRTDPVMLSRELLGSGEEHLGLRTSEHLVVFLNSRFSPHFHAWVKRSKDAFQFMNIVLDEDLDCQSAVDVPSEWDWPGYLERVSEEASNQELEIEGAVIFAMNTRATKNMNQKLLECPLGMLSILAHQLEVGLGMLTEQISMVTYLMAFGADMIETQLKSPDWLLRALLQSRWPVFTKLAASALLIQARNSWQSPARYQNKPYKLDFLPSELLYPLDERHQLPHGTTSAALKLRRNAWRRSESYAQLMRALQTSLENAPALRGRHVVMFTLVFGTRYAGYLPRWIQRAVAFGHGARTLLFCLDENTVKVCESHHPFPALCVPGEVKTTANKFHFTSVVVNSGFDVLYLDFDTIFFKDPLPPVLQAAEKADMLLTRDFGTECINIGVVFMKSHPDNAQFMEDLIIWLWHHPYEFCQKAFAGVMGLEDVQWNSIFGDIVRSVPRWAFLDSLNAFVTSTIYGEGAMGWTGREDQIVIYHFLDGTGGVDSSISVRGYVNLFDLFYANDRLNLSETETPLYVQDPQIQVQLDFSRLEGPVQLQACSHLEEAAFPAWKLRQRHDLRNRRDIRPIELS